MLTQQEAERLWREVWNSGNPWPRAIQGATRVEAVGTCGDSFGEPVRCLSESEQKALESDPRRNRGESNLAFVCRIGGGLPYALPSES